MKVIGKDIGSAIDALYEEIERRLKVEAERDLTVEAFEGGAFSNVSWRPDSVLIELHNGVPTHALPHVLGVALQHVRQRLDRYPAVRRALQNDPEGAAIIRGALRELILAPEADQQLERYGLDTEWEVQQRHAGYKDMLRDAADSWNERGSPGHAFASLQYARFALDHPPKLWESLQELTAERLPAAVEGGEGVLDLVRQAGWNSPGACVESLLAARNELGLEDYALIEDRRSGAVG